MPPVMPTVALYGSPTVPPGSNVAVKARAAGPMVIVSGPMAFCAGLPESVTLTVTVDAPADAGVPLTRQPAIANPLGSVPFVIEQL